MRAAANRASSAHRSQRRRWARDVHAVADAVAPPADGRTDVDVLRAVAALAPMQRAVVYLIYWEDRTERQTAEVLGISLGSVRRHVVRARAHLRKALS